MRNRDWERCKNI